MRKVFLTLVVLAIGALATVSPADSPAVQAFDREECIYDCQDRYWGSNQPAIGRLYARCIRKCERKADQEFDKKINDLKEQATDL
ncbi:hypothetical protein ACFL2Q_11520 [Thermodesulfobacteriota bacterium]